MQIRFGSILGVASLGLLLTALPALSSTVQYTDSTTWTLATTGIIPIVFQTLGQAPNYTDYSVSGLSINDVTFLGITTEAYKLQVEDSNWNGGWFNFGDGATLRGPSSDRASVNAFLPYIHIILPANVTAFSTNMATVSPNQAPIQVTLSNNEVFTVDKAGPRPSTEFFGVTTDLPISFIDLALPTSEIHGASYTVLANFSYGTASTTAGGGTGGDPGDPPDAPEACTMILIGTGLVTFRYLRKKGFGLGTATL